MSGYKPIIGITVEGTHMPDDIRSGGSLKLNWNYTQVISDAGGVPILIPPTADPAVIAGLIDGLLIPGGLDIDAARFGEDNHESVELQDPSRFESEIGIYSHLAADQPILGICYGCQFLNVARGGSLIQHLPDVVESDSHSGGTLQAYDVDQQSQLAGIFATGDVKGTSYHHQAVKDLGEGLRVVAKSEDGVVEAVEATDRPWVIGVQWHPERTADSVESKNLFARFIAEARSYAVKQGRGLA